MYFPKAFKAILFSLVISQRNCSWGLRLVNWGQICVQVSISKDRSELYAAHSIRKCSSFSTLLHGQRGQNLVSGSLCVGRIVSMLRLCELSRGLVSAYLCVILSIFSR